MKNKFKFELGEKVFIVGLAGLAVVTGRGSMSLTSGGELNMYQLGGAHRGILQEAEIMPQEIALEYPKMRKDRR